MPHDVPVQELMDSARSEVKRWGGTEPTLTHVAYVLARRWPKEFEVTFGGDGADRITELLRSGRFVGTEADTSALLAGEGGRSAILTQLRDRLDATVPVTADQVADEPDAEPSAEGKADELPKSDDDEPRLPAGLGPIAAVETSARAVEARTIAAQLTRIEPVTVAIVADHGVGRTHLLGEIAQLVAGLPDPPRMLRLAPDTVIANPSATLEQAMKSASGPTIIVIDDFDDLAMLSSQAPDMDLIRTIDRSRFKPGVRLALVITPRYVSRLAVLSSALADALEQVLIHELDEETVAQIVRERGNAIAVARGLTVDDAAFAAALTPASPIDASVHPGLAISRLDLACAHAVLAGSPTVDIAHLVSGSTGARRDSTTTALDVALTEAVKGQPDAVLRVARRLAITRRNLDLRPERPNGVFLFAGPTGVGKTELARAIALHEFGGLDRLIRLDMSEYSQEWALSRIAGPAPGYVGSTEPESWLTTKVAAAPHSVILLDEIEKAHPTIWNTFLQVFDAGRLTDGRGVTADFRDTVVIMTSNLGVREASRRTAGFGEDLSNGARERQLAEIRARMAPELLNRLDDIILFEPLSVESILEIAENELTRMRVRLSSSGWDVTLDDGVAEWLAQTGYDPNYGARHLQRNIETELLSLLADLTERTVRIRRNGEHLEVV